MRLLGWRGTCTGTVSYPTIQKVAPSRSGPAGRNENTRLRLPRSAALCLTAVALSLGCGEPALAPDFPDAGSTLEPATAGLTAAPADLTASASTPTAISLAWTDNSSDESGFQVWRSTSGSTGSYALRRTSGADVTNLTDTGLAPGHQYCYKVRAVGGAAGASPYSGIACATTPLKPPTIPSGKVTAAATITVTWKDNSANEVGFELWRSTTGTSGSYSLLSTLAENATSAADSGVAAGQQYCYKVRAIGSETIPPSGFSGKVCAKTPSPPAAPKSLLASAASPTAVALVWTDNASNESGFEVWRSTSGSAGPYALRATVAANISNWDDGDLTASVPYCYKVRAVGAAFAPPSAYTVSSCATTPASVIVRIVLFGDSNTDRCEEVSPPGRRSSYVSVTPRLAPDDPPLACSVAGKVQASWTAAGSEAIRIVNHAIASTTSGGGSFGGPNRSSAGSPNARTVVGGVSRFQAEAMGRGYPWSGGEPTNSSFPSGPIRRVNAFAPGPNDFVYVSMGTNDDAGPTRTMTAAQTVANLRYMIEQWTAAGRSPDHFVLTTLAPRDDANSPGSIADRNTLIRALAAELGVHLIDLAAFTSDDNGATWGAPSLNIGDGIHYTEAVRGWLGEQIVDWMAGF